MSTILIVDDAPTTRKILAALIGNVGDHRVLAAATADEALRLFEVEKPVGVLMDLHLDEATDGIALARRMRALPGGATARIALVTADARDDPEDSHLFDAVFEKPVRFQDIRSFLEGGIR